MKRKIKLDDIEKVDVFQPSEAYMNELPDRIEARVRKAEGGKQVFFAPQKQRWILYAAASFTLLLAVWFAIPSRDSNTVDTLLAEVEDRDVINYLSNSELELDDLIQYSSRDDVSDLGIDSLLLNEDADALLPEYLEQQYPVLDDLK